MTNDTCVLGRAALSLHILIQPRPRQRPSYNVDAENVSEGRTRKCLATRDARSELYYGELCRVRRGDFLFFLLRSEFSIWCELYSTPFKSIYVALAD